MNWDEFISQEMEKDYFVNLSKILAIEDKSHKIYPPKDKIFNAFDCCKFDDTKVVILGQDPYISPGQAQGLSFSVPKSFPLPPSLQNIFKELKNDLGISISKNGDLTKWAKQGVLLLNTILTVRQGLSKSHCGIGWEKFTNQVIKTLNDKKDNLVFILWGNDAKSKKGLIDQNKHFIIESVHPSPLSAYAGFFGSAPFSKTNEYLKSKNLPAIDWYLDDENS